MSAHDYPRMFTSATGTVIGRVTFREPINFLADDELVISVDFDKPADMAGEPEPEPETPIEIPDPPADVDNVKGGEPRSVAELVEDQAAIDRAVGRAFGRHVVIETRWQGFKRWLRQSSCRHGIRAEVFPMYSQTVHARTTPDAVPVGRPRVAWCRECHKTWLTVS